MTSRIKHVSELPDWFHLDKYKKAKKLGAAGWYEQFALRGKIVDWFNTEIEAEIQDLVKAQISEALTLIRETPIFDLNGEGRGKISEIFSFYDAKHVSKNHNHLPAVHPMTLEQFNLLRSALDPKKVEYVKLWSEQFEAESLDSRIYKYEPWIRQPLIQSANEETRQENDFGFYGIDPVIVDLNYPDKILIETFKQHLATRRAESKTEVSVQVPMPAIFSAYL